MKNNFLALIFASTFFVAMVKPSEGAYVANHYVTPNAPATSSQTAYNACTNPATPCSLMCAVTYAVAGDVVKVASGVYNAPLGDDRWIPGFGIANNGTAENPIVFYAEYPAALNYDSAQFSSRRSELRNGGTTAENAHPVIGTPNYDSPAKHVILDGFYINGAPGYAPAAPSGGSVNISTRGHFTVRNFVFDVFHLGGYDNFVPIFVGPNGEVPAVGPIILENNLFVGGGGSGYNQNASCVTTYAANNFIFQNNEFRDVNNGFYIKGYGNGGIIRYNKAINPSGNLAQINSIRDGLTVSVYQNIVINPGGSGIFYGMSPPGTRRGALVYNNTIVGDDPSSGLVVLGGYQDYTDQKFYNNLLAALAPNTQVFINAWQSTGYASIAGFDPFNHNLYFNNGSEPRFALNGEYVDSFSAWRSATGRDQNSIVSNPQFVDPAIGNYRLSSGSPARTAGSTSGPVGAYITGNEIIGIIEEEADITPPSAPIGLTIN